MKGDLMMRAPFLALPTLALLAACGTQENATTQSETATVPGDDGAVAAPADTMEAETPGSVAPTTATDTRPAGSPPDANEPERAGPENAQGDNRMRTPGPANPPPDGTTPPPR